MLSSTPNERRKSLRRRINRLAKIQFGTASLPRDCLITDMSEGGVRLHVEGVEVPDEFVLLLSDDDASLRPRDCRIAWRLGFEIGAEFIRFPARTP